MNGRVTQGTARFGLTRGLTTHRSSEPASPEFAADRQHCQLLAGSVERLHAHDWLGGHDGGTCHFNEGARSDEDMIVTAGFWRS